MRRGLPSSLRILLVVFAASLFWRYEWVASRATDAALGPAIVKLAVWVIPALAFAMVAGRRGPAGAWRDLGLAGAPWRGLTFGLIATLPMAVMLLTGRGRVPAGSVLAADVVLGPFAEEVLFRGLLFVGLRRIGWSFWPAATVSSVLFGVAHVRPVFQLLWGGSDSALALGQFELYWDAMFVRVAVNTGGGLLFAWVVEAFWSLWPAIGLHAAINFWSELIWGEAGLRGIVDGQSVLWSVASCASLAIAALLARRYRRSRVSR
jgi:membrane protease YdiL (CAAX protease family)